MVHGYRRRHQGHGRRQVLQAKSQFNRVTKAKRQPGSAFKPFVYLAASNRASRPNSVEIDEPVRIGDWEPENYRQKYLGPVTLDKALALSLNTVAAKLVSRSGPKRRRAWPTASASSRRSATMPRSRSALRKSRLLELTSAFVPFANGGIAGRALSRSAASPRATARCSMSATATDSARRSPIYDLGAMNHMLRAVVTEGTARRAQFGDFEIAGKTGTSQDYRDAWFIGYTSYLIAGVWVGNDDNSPTKKVTGGSIPAAIWKDVMELAHAGLIAAAACPATAMRRDELRCSRACSSETAISADRRRGRAARGQRLSRATVGSLLRQSSDQSRRR